MDNEQSLQHDSNIEHQIEQDVTQPQTAFDLAKYQQMTLEQKFAVSKESVFKQFGVQENVQAAPTIAEQVKNDSYLSDRMAIHADNSVSVKGNVLGNDRASSALISHLRNEVYKKYGIEGAD